MKASDLQNLLLEVGVPRVNVPVWTPRHPTFKAVVVASYTHRSGRKKHSLIRFGNWKYPHDWAERSAIDYWTRNQKKVRRGRSAGEYWEWYYLFAPGAEKWAPGEPRPEGQMTKGRKL